MQLALSQRPSPPVAQGLSLAQLPSENSVADVSQAAVTLLRVNCLKESAGVNHLIKLHALGLLLAKAYRDKQALEVVL